MNAEPLTPEEEAAFREDAEDDSEDTTPGASRCRALLATLDRDRARIAVLSETAQRLVDAIGDEAAVQGLRRDGHPQGWKAEMDAADATLCALQDTRTALDGRDRPHTHVLARAALPAGEEVHRG